MQQYTNNHMRNSCVQSMNITHLLYIFSLTFVFYIKCRFIQKMGWDTKLVNKSYPWVEKQIVHRPTFSHWQRAFRDGLLDAGVSPFNGFTYEHKYGTKVGGTIFDRFGRRHTAAELLSSGNPNKLTVLIYATVQKIVFDTTGRHIYNISLNLD